MNIVIHCRNVHFMGFFGSPVLSVFLFFQFFRPTIRPTGLWMILGFFRISSMPFMERVSGNGSTHVICHYPLLNAVICLLSPYKLG